MLGMTTYLILIIISDEEVLQCLQIHNKTRSISVTCFEVSDSSPVLNWAPALCIYLLKMHTECVGDILKRGKSTTAFSLTSAQMHPAPEPCAHTTQCEQSTQPRSSELTPHSVPRRIKGNTSELHPACSPFGGICFFTHLMTYF